MRSHVRVARPTNNLEEILRFYKDGLGFSVLSVFEDHDGFDGVMIGHPQMDYHLEFTRKKGHTGPKSPTQDNLLVFYIQSGKVWQKAVDRMIDMGFKPVESFNPYWDKRGKTFEDVDEYRVVLYNGVWK